MDPLELDRLLYGEDGPGLDEFADPLVDMAPAVVPPDMSVAGWHARKAQAIRADRERLAAVFDDEAERLAETRARVLGKYDRAAGWHDRAVEVWHRGNVREVGKTVEFPSGARSELRGSQPKVDVVDGEALRVWAAGVADANGEAIEGRIWVRQDPKFMVSELKRFASVPKKKGGREPGSVVDLVGPDGKTVPGVRAVVLPDRWQSGK